MPLNHTDVIALALELTLCADKARVRAQEGAGSEAVCLTSHGHTQIYFWRVHVTFIHRH